MNDSQQLHHYMDCALAEAEWAFAKEEVPVGAVIVYQDQIIGKGHNLRESRQSPVAHAEILALEEASQSLKRWRLEETTVYVTLEPCAMCAGALVLARVKKIVYALPDPKSGGCGSVFNIVDNPRLNHKIEVIEGIRRDESLEMLRKFFRKQRKNPKYRKKKDEK